MTIDLPRRSPEEQAASLTALLDQRPASWTEGVWLFVYGLLAHAPPFVYETAKVVTLDGYQRAFQLMDPLNRGTPAQPGLTLGLEPGGQTTGVAYFMAPEQMAEGLEKVWQQEMLVPFYTPCWLEIEGQTMIVMVTDPNSPALCQHSINEVASIVGSAAGAVGTNRAYFDDVRAAFGAYGVKDDYLEALQGVL